MEVHTATENSCPLAAVDQRLADVHRLWHQAEAAYFDPDGFRLAIQNAIQTLRSVTFILQKQKAIFPNFAVWYGDSENKTPGEWQRRLGADPLMRWMVDARNRIEKQGDLESNSIVRAEIVASYLEEGPRIEVPVHLFDNISTLLHNIPDTALGEHIRRNGMLRIERRWVENSLPNYELLDAVAIAFGKVAELVHDAHRQIGLIPPPTIHDDNGRSYDLPSMGWRLPCMIGHELPRTLLISLSDGTVVESETKIVSIESDPSEVAALVERYNGNPFEIMGQDYRNEADLAAGYFKLARSVFLRDGYHLTILFLFRDRKPVGGPIWIKFEGVPHKYALMRQLAVEVIKSGANAAMMVGEVWKASASELMPYQRPADSPVRKEALTLSLVGKNGATIACEAEIIREEENVSLGETHVADHLAAFQFAPFLEAWGCPVPDSWIEASGKIDAATRRE